MKVLNRHKSYEDYVLKQKEKTLDPQRIKRWQGEEWQIKVDGFNRVFDRNAKYVSEATNALCLGSRTGQEVAALRDRGIATIGIDLVEFLPYTITGDIHDLQFGDREFDLVFTNIFDHSMYPDKLVSEMERVCKGFMILNLQVGIKGDNYSENFVDKPESVVKLFKSELVESRKIDNQFDGMNWELVFKK